MDATLRSVTWGLGNSDVELKGALSTSTGRHGVALSRLGENAEAQSIDPQLVWMGRMPSGARLAFETDSDVVEIDAHVTRLGFLGNYPFQAAFELVVDDRDVHTVATTETAAVNIVDPATGQMEQIPHPPTTIRFDNLGSGTKRLDLWLPHNATVEIVDVRLAERALVSRTPARRHWVHYGSSISHCLEARTPTTTWPAAVARKRNLDLTNLALGGQAHLDQHAARSIRDAAPDLISLKVGINVINHDSMRERAFVPALHGFLDTIRDGLPTTPILVITPIICPVVEDHPGPTIHLGPQVGITDRPPGLSAGALTLRRIRDLVSQIVDSRISHGDKNLQLLDGLSLFGPDDLDELPDGLHPSPEGYLRIADRFDRAVFQAGGLWASTQHEAPSPSSAAAATS